MIPMASSAAGEILLHSKKQVGKKKQNTRRPFNAESVWAEQRTTRVANYFAWLRLKIICSLIIKKHCITV